MPRPRRTRPANHRPGMPGSMLPSRRRSITSPRGDEKKEPAGVAHLGERNENAGPVAGNLKGAAQGGQERLHVVEVCHRTRARHGEEQDNTRRRYLLIRRVGDAVAHCVGTETANWEFVKIKRSPTSQAIAIGFPTDRAAPASSSD